MRRLNAPALKTRLPAAQPRLSETKPRKPVPRRRPAPPRWRARLWRIGGLASLLLTLAFAGGWVWHARLPVTAWNALHDSLVAGTADAGWRLRIVQVEGRQRTPRDQVLASLGVQLNQPMLAIDPQAVKANLEALGWVRSASVERRLPDTLFIRINEAEPIALWQHDGGFRLIDRSGQVIDQVDASTFGQLLVLVGEGAPTHAADLLAMLAREPDLAPRVRGAVWVGERRWNLRLDNGVDVKLPAESPQQAWSLLAKLEREQRLLARDLSVIDMRLPDRLVVRMGAGAELQHGTQIRQPGSNT
jgi:cell division protein FtsQ